MKHALVMKGLIRIGLVSLILSGCAGLQPPGSKPETLVERDGVDIAIIPASYREVYLAPRNSNERHCRSPDPDFTVQSSEKLTLSDSVAGSHSDDVGFGEGQAAMTLGGRTSTLLIARELMFRACELASNVDADTETTRAIYTEFLEAIKALSMQQQAVGTSSMSDSAVAN